ncbi:lactate utilization protein [uncultured Desulfobacter sp.]|uniref:lactate utilization protein n=1 Tax=uncultured Desulfobacter sp. TaxID=240139 RepID=UPI002AAACB3F|nr:lactate utilization protein [uncultured Desulfobacter sp.]
MENPIDNYWKLKLESVKQRLEGNRFEVYIADSSEEAKNIALKTIIPPLGAKTLSWGGSVSFVSTGLFHALKDNPDFEVINTFDQSLSPEQKFELRRRSLMADLFITGTNAITEEGQLVNLDMIGNRVAAIMWGPKTVLLIVGRNKICPNIEDAMCRVKNYAAPVNCMKLDKKTPCAKAGFCHDCSSPDRICNYWTITEKSFEKGRIKIILVNEALGF